MGRFGGLETIKASSKLDKRRRCKLFTVLMVIFSALYGGLIAYRTFGFQADYMTDIVKVSLAVGLATGLFAFFFWTLILRKKETYLRAALAGILTAICVLPVPAFIWAVKSQIHTVLNAETEAMLSEIGSIFSLAGENFLWSFSLAEAITLPLSAMVGMIVFWKG